MPTMLSSVSTAVSTFLARLRERWVLSLVGVVALLVALGLGLGFGLTGGGSDAHDAARREVVNRAGGYRMMVPQGWQVTRKKDETLVVAPGNTAVITAGLGPKAPLPEAADTFFTKIKNRFSHVKQLEADSKQISDAPARVFGGIGTGRNGNRLWFRAIIIEHQPTTYVIAIKVDSTRVRQLFSEVTSVVSTFDSLQA